MTDTTPHSSMTIESNDFPTLGPKTFSSSVCHQGAYRFGSPVLINIINYCILIILANEIQVINYLDNTNQCEKF